MKKIFLAVLAAGLALYASPARAALTAGGVAALDGSGNERTSFTNVETLALRQRVSNSVASESMIQFKFTVYNPAGGAVFHHEGNSTRATLGNSNSQISGLSIASFYSVPGVYRFRAQAVLGAETVTQEVSFQISSPNINLIYPPNGAKGLTDSPLVFRWVASGAALYKITIAKDAGLAQQMHSATTASALYSTPDELSSTEKMVANTNYYWKVEGLDATGVRIAESNVYSFTLKAQSSSQSRNVAVTLLELSEAVSDFGLPMQFRALVQNTGGTSETNISIKMTLGGQPAQDSPKNVGMLGAGESRSFSFTAFMPQGQTEGLAVACLDLFDDNIPDNCKTKLVAKAAGPGVAEGKADSRSLSYQEIWEEVIKRLGPDVASALEGYTFEAIECADCAGGELNDIMLALMEGNATLAGATLAESYQPAGTSAASAATALALEPEPEERPEMDLDIMEGREDQEWSGYTTAVKSKKPFFYTVKGSKAWEKTWGMLSTEKTPKVDFDEKTVVGVIAGSENKAETVRILARKQFGDTTVFEYYMTESSSLNPAVPYFFRTYGKVEGKVEFRRLDTGE